MYLVSIWNAKTLFSVATTKSKVRFLPPAPSTLVENVYQLSRNKFCFSKFQIFSNDSFKISFMESWRIFWENLLEIHLGILQIFFWAPKRKFSADSLNNSCGYFSINYSGDSFQNYPGNFFTNSLQNHPENSESSGNFCINTFEKKFEDFFLKILHRYYLRFLRILKDNFAVTVNFSHKSLLK